MRLSAFGPCCVTVPASGARIPPSIDSSVVLPAPLGPMIASSSPRATSKLTSRTARREPKLFATPSTTSDGASGGAATAALTVASSPALMPAASASAASESCRFA